MHVGYGFLGGRVLWAESSQIQQTDDARGEMDLGCEASFLEGVIGDGDVRFDEWLTKIRGDLYRKFAPL